MKPPRRPTPPTIATVISEALVLVEELHPDHWPTWLELARAAAHGEPWAELSTTSLRLALARGSTKRGPTCAADLEALRSALREVSR